MIHDELKKVFEIIDDYRDEIIDFTRRLVKIPSIAGTPMEGEAQKLVIGKIKNEIEGATLDVFEPSIEELRKYPLHPIRIQEWTYKGRPNVVSIIGKNKGRSLILNGHIDVASPEPLDLWNYDPWGAEVENGRIYGRGAADMKAGIACIIYSVAAIIKAGLIPKGKVIIESVVEEENGGGGAIATLLKGYTADAAIITESTSSKAICIGAGGSRFFTIKVLGQPTIAHISHKGLNAIDCAIKIYQLLKEIGDKRLERIRGKYPLFENVEIDSVIGTGIPTSLVVGIMRAGDWPTTLAGWAEIQGRIGFPPDERGDDVVKEIESEVMRVAKSDFWMSKRPPKIYWWGPRKEGYLLSENEAIVKVLRQSIKEVLREEAVIYATPSNSDGNYFVKKINGYGGIPTVLYGPYGKNAHAANEYVEIEDIILTTKVLATVILKWCGYEKFK